MNVGTGSELNSINNLIIQMNKLINKEESTSHTTHNTYLLSFHLIHLWKSFSYTWILSKIFICFKLHNLSFLEKQVHLFYTQFISKLFCFSETKITAVNHIFRYYCDLIVVGLWRIFHKKTSVTHCIECCKSSC